MKITKKLVACLSAFAVVSVATVGFATWLVGVTQNSQNVFLTAQVDDVKNETAFLEASIAPGTTIAIAEKEVTPRGETTIVGTSTDKDGISVSKDALKFSFEKVEVRLGKSLATLPKSVKVTINNEKTAANQVKTNTMGETYRRALGAGTEYWTYLAADITIPFTTEGEGANFTVDKESDGTFDIYKLKNLDYELDWGTFFGGDEPTVFYNGLVNEQEFKELLTMSTNAYTELAAMNKALAGQTITLTVSLDYPAK